MADEIVLPASLAEILGFALLVAYLGARWREMQAQGLDVIWQDSSVRRMRDGEAA